MKRNGLTPWFFFVLGFVVGYILLRVVFPVVR